MENKKVIELARFMREPLLVVEETEGGIAARRKLFTDSGFIEARDDLSLLCAIKDSKELCFCLDPETVSKMAYDIITQFQLGDGEIQLARKSDLVLERHNYDPEKTRIAFLARKDLLQKIEERFPIRDKVGGSVEV